MRNSVILGILLLFAAAAGNAATLTVTTDADEANCNCNVAACSPNPVCVHTTGNYPQSTGCSLREALQDIADAAAPATISFPECGTPDPAPGSNTIVLGAHAIQIFSLVPDPSDSTGVAMKSNGVMPFIINQDTAGTLTITGGVLSCAYDPQAQPPIGGNSMITTANNASVEFQGTSFQNCKAPADGVAIVNSGNTDGDLILTNTTFTNIRAINQGNGGCISHGSGNLVVTASSFSGCVVDDGGLVFGGGSGNGGAIYIRGAGGTSRALITTSTFQGNIAGNNGGALYLDGTDAIAIGGTAFQANIAAGNTFDTGNAELGGGAIYATGTADNGNDGSQQGIFPSAFLIFQTSFIGNLAPNGTGGAILLTGAGHLTYGTLTFNIADYIAGTIGGIPGGIVASNFSANIAGGSWDTVNNGNLEKRAGAGGAVYASGYLSVLSSSFVGANTSTNASGGAIAYYDASDGFTPMEISNVTFNSNSAGANGGAIANLAGTNTNNSGKVTLINDTIAGNSATGVGGGIFNTNTTAAEFQVSNTILANNTGTASNENCGGTAVTDTAGNLQFNPDNTCGSMPVGDPLLQAAAPFGGVNALVFVMQLGDGSAAHGAGDQPTCTASPIDDLDAVLNSRPQGKPDCDTGAFESESTTPVKLQSFEVD